LRDDRHADWEQEEQLAERNEELRLLYVGLTRAQYALHIVWGVSRSEDFNGSALRWLLHGGQRGGSKKGEVKPGEIDARIDRLAADSAGSIVVRDIPDPIPASSLLRPLAEMTPPPAPRTVARVLPEPFGQYSFSSLRAQHRELLPARGADDETAISADPDEDRSLSGPDFGNTVHDVLETADFDAWRNAIAPPPQEMDRLREALQRRGLPQNDNATMQVGALVARALNTPLPGIATLAELMPGHYVREMEFHFRLGAVRLPQLFERLARYGYPRAYPASRQERMKGLMHGYIDLLYRDREGRYFVVDYKTNRLPDYSSATLTEAIRGHDYDLQYLIYLVAAQRWLKLRLGGRYDGERQLGGAVYLFLRGLKPGDAVAGVYCDRPPQALIDRLDHWFDGGEA
ncbi:MAG: PD-(D/E)XK nuclease family protein, partial [Xanthomonadaceae bacterium]|nr:PD-(D/E)XK nuclease family protein [Xanthomonadaceae bacterium]